MVDGGASVTARDDIPNHHVPLRDYLEGLRAADHKADAADWANHRRAHESERQEREEAKQTVAHRLGELNNLRSEVINDRGQFVRRDVMEAEFTSLRKSIADSQKAIATLQGATDSVVDAARSYSMKTIATVGIMVTIAAVIIGAVLQ